MKQLLAAVVAVLVGALVAHGQSGIGSIVTPPGGTAGQLQSNGGGYFKGVPGSKVSGSTVAVGEVDASTGAFGAAATRSTFTATGELDMANSAPIMLSGPGGNVISKASVTASAFFGDGSHLSGIVSGGTPGGAAGQLQYNAGGVFGGSSALAASTGTLTGNAFSVGGSTFVIAGGSATVAFQMTAGSFSGNGANVTAISASNVTAGTLPNAQLSGAYTNITGLGTLTSKLSITGTDVNGVGLNVSGGAVVISMTASSATITALTVPTVVSSATFQQDVQAAGSTVTFNATQTINWQAQGPRVTIVVTANTTSSTWSNATQRGLYTITIVQGGAGSFTYTWPTNIVWPNQGTAPALSAAVGARDYFVMMYDTDLKFHVLAEALNN